MKLTLPSRRAYIYIFQDELIPLYETLPAVKCLYETCIACCRHMNTFQDVLKCLHETCIACYQHMYT